MAKTKVTGEYLKDSVVRFTAKAGENITKGNAVYISGISGELPVVSLADADDTAKMPAFGLAEATVSTNAEVEVTSFGTLANLDTSSYTLGDILYVDTTAGALTNDPAGLEATKLQNIGIVQRVHASNGSIKVGGAGRTNAVPNLDDGDIFIGDSNNKAVSSALSTEIESYLDGGTSTPTFASATVSGDLTVDTDTLFVDASADSVGINTTSPSFQNGNAGLHIVDATSPAIRLQDSNAVNSDFEIYSPDGVNNLRIAKGGTDFMSLDSSGVGIGTTGPASILHAIDDSTADSKVLRLGNGYTTDAANDAAGIMFGLYRSYSPAVSDSGFIKSVKEQAWDATDDRDAALTFGTRDGASEPTERMRIDSLGRVGIGTDSPTAKLHIGGDDAYTALTIRDNTASADMFSITCAEYVGSAPFNVNKFTAANSSEIGFETGGSERMRIDGTHGDLTLITSHSGGTYPFRVGYGSYASFTPTVVIDDSNRLTVGASSALSLGVIGSKFNGSLQNGIVVETTRDATGSTFIRFNDSDSAAIGSIYQNGASTVLYATSSDYRLKENVIYDWTALDRLNQLKPARFNFIADADTTVDGFLAHEVQDIVPEAIMGIHNEIEVWKEGEELPEGVNVGDNKTDEDGNTIPVYQGIDQSKLVPLLVKALQEADDKIDALTARIETLENA